MEVELETTLTEVVDVLAPYATTPCVVESLSGLRLPSRFEEYEHRSWNIGCSAPDSSAPPIPGDVWRQFL